MRRIAIDEHRPRADPLDGVRRGDVGLRGDDHLVARPEAEVQIRQVQRGHARADAHAVRVRSHERGEFRLEGFALRPVRQDVAVEHLEHRPPIRVGDPRTAERNLTPIRHSQSPETIRSRAPARPPHTR